MGNPTSTRKFLVKAGLHDLNTGSLLNKGRNVATMLTGNETYEALQAQLPALSSACDLLAAADAAVLFNGGKVAHQSKRDAETLVRSILTVLAEQVQVLSQGDKAAILSAGFDVRREPAPISELPVPQDLRAQITDFQGRIALDWKVVYGAYIYQVWMTAGDPTLTTGWEMVGVSTKTRHHVDNLEVGKFYSFRVNAVGARAESGMSDNAMCMAA
jgi:hypothetical protein